MNEDVIESTEQTTDSSDSVYESVEQVVEDIQNSTITEEETSEDLNEQSELDLEEDSSEVEETSEESEEEKTEDEKPESTVIQVKEDETSETGYTTTELDVESLNIMSQAYVEQMLAVTPTSNDYYDFIGSDILEYFSDVMANYPLNDYRAYHLRHWVSSSQYYNYYDDYYYLFYDFNGDSAEECLEIYKANNASNYRFNWGTAEVLNSSIMYGSGENMADLRKGVSYVQEMALLCSIGIVFVLFVLGAIFKHIRS